MATAILINPPFAPLNMPNIGLSILATVARGRDHRIDIRYAGFSLANMIGTWLYKVISNGYPTNTALAGEFLFSSSYYTQSSQYFDRFVATHLLPPADGQMLRLTRPGFHDEFLAGYYQASLCISRWLESFANSIAQYRPQLVGFGTMFQQTFSSLALARRIKELHPSCLIIFGGANVEDPMGIELLRCFPFVDYVCSGEGEEAFLSLLDAIDCGHYSNHPNLRAHPVGQLQSIPVMSAFHDISRLPMPEYDDFFEQVHTLKDTRGIEIRVLLELSRGCWWGAKSHCTFCGLNGRRITFRSKPPEKAFEEITRMQSKYPNTPISIVDNILDWRYIDTLIPRLADRGGIHEVFVETKSTLTKTQLRMMRMAGIKRIQPGIESLSTSVLKLMKKGVSAAQNIAFLRRCLEVGIKPEWNLLWGFPNEDLSEYAKMPELISHIIHLPPPIAASTLRIDRYSPLFEKASHETIARIRPHSAYESIFDSSDVNIERLAYYFEIDYQDGRQPHCYTEELVRGCRKWQESWHEAFLFYLIVDTNVIVADGRNPEQVRMMRFPGRVIHLLEHCECPHRREDVISWFNGMMGADSQLCLEELINRHLLLEVDDSIVTVVSNLFDFPHNSEKIVSFVQSMNRQADRYDDTMLTVKVPEVTC